jgi:hypothetical protein
MYWLVVKAAGLRLTQVAGVTAGTVHSYLSGDGGR